MIEPRAVTAAVSDCQHEWTVLIICSQIQVGRTEIRVCRKCGHDASVQTTPAALAAYEVTP